MQRQWARLARRGWCAAVVPAAPPGPSKRSYERLGKRSTPRGAVQRELLWAYRWCSGYVQCCFLPRPRLVIAMRFLLFGAFGVATSKSHRASPGVCHMGHR